MNRDALKVVLVSPRNPLNIGAAARAMSNFGFLNLRVVDAYDVAYAEARSAVNASAVLERSQQYATLGEAVADCSLVVGTTSVGHRDLQHSLKTLELAGRRIRTQLDSGSIALIFGSEKFGLSNEQLSYCHWLTRIPTREEHHSMNLGQAVAVCLYELIRSSEAELRNALAPKPAAAGDVERIGDYLFEALTLSGYVPERTASSAGQKVRRMLHRIRLTETDAPMWLGMMRQIVWKLKRE
jgi:TrmH family RNA methyltransferase